MLDLPEIEVTPLGIAPHVRNQTIAYTTMRQPKFVGRYLPIFRRDCSQRSLRV